MIVYLVLECGVVLSETGTWHTPDGITHGVFTSRAAAEEFAERMERESKFLAWRIVERRLEEAEE